MPRGPGARSWARTQSAPGPRGLDPFAFGGRSRKTCLFFVQALHPLCEEFGRAGATIRVNFVDRVMKLASPKSMGQVAGVCCRQAPLRGLLGALIVCACFIGAAVLVRQRGFPWFVWGWCAALAALIAPLMIADALAK